MIKVFVKGIGLDNITGSPILLLANQENESEIFPIWIGVAEAEGIMISHSRYKPPRPLTYDLFKDVIEKLGGTIKAVKIVDKVEGVYIANIVLEQEGREIQIDSRPSDAVNLAIRFNAPIFLNEEIVEKVKWEDIEPKTSNHAGSKTSISDTEKKATISDEELENLKKFIENVKPDDFLLGKGEAV